MKRFRKVTKRRLFTRHMAGLGRPVRPNGALRSHRTCSLRCRPRTRSHLHLFPSHKAAPSLGWKEEQKQTEDRVGRTEKSREWALSCLHSWAREGLRCIRLLGINLRAHLPPPASESQHLQHLPTKGFSQVNSMRKQSCHPSVGRGTHRGPHTPPSGCLREA